MFRISFFFARSRSGWFLFCAACAIELMEFFVYFLSWHLFFAVVHCYLSHNSHPFGILTLCQKMQFHVLHCCFGMKEMGRSRHEIALYFQGRNTFHSEQERVRDRDRSGEVIFTSRNVLMASLFISSNAMFKMKPFYEKWFWDKTKNHLLSKRNSFSSFASLNRFHIIQMRSNHFCFHSFGVFDSQKQKRCLIENGSASMNW